MLDIQQKCDKILNWKLLGRQGLLPSAFRQRFIKKEDTQFMKKTLKRSLAILIALAMVILLFPGAAFAEEPMRTGAAGAVRIFTAEDQAILDLCSDFYI